MAGMEGLGRVLNVVPIASAKAISMKQCSGVTFVCTGADTFSLTIATTFGGTYRAGSFQSMTRGLTCFPQTQPGRHFGLPPLPVMTPAYRDYRICHV